MTNKIKMTMIGGVLLTLSGCTTMNLNGLAGDVRLDDKIGSAELRAACADRAQKGILWQTGIFAANIALSPAAGIAAGTLESNPLTENYSKKCRLQAEFDNKNKE